jgi:hypothetical protein
MKLTCEAFGDGGAVPRDFTCDGEDRSPPLQWSNAPAESKSFVLLVDDLDAPSGVFHHWACYDIPAYHTELVDGAGGRRGSRTSGTPSMISANWATTARVRRRGTGCIATGSACSRSTARRSRSARIRVASKSRTRRASISCPRRG